MALAAWRLHGASLDREQLVAALREQDAVVSELRTENQELADVIDERQSRNAAIITELQMREVALSAQLEELSSKSGKKDKHVSKDIQPDPIPEQRDDAAEQLPSAVHVNGHPTSSESADERTRVAENAAALRRATEQSFPQRDLAYENELKRVRAERDSLHRAMIENQRRNSQIIEELQIRELALQEEIRGARLGSHDGTGTDTNSAREMEKALEALKTAKEENAALKQEVDALKARHSGGNDDDSSNPKELQALRESIAERDRHCAELENELQEKGDTIEILQEQVKGLEEAVREEQRQHAMDVDEQVMELQVLLAKETSITSRARSDVQRYKEQTESLRIQLEDAQQQISAQAEENRSLRMLMQTEEGDPAVSAQPDETSEVMGMYIRQLEEEVENLRSAQPDGDLERAEEEISRLSSLLSQREVNLEAMHTRCELLEQEMRETTSRLQQELESERRELWKLLGEEEKLKKKSTAENELRRRCSDLEAELAAERKELWKLLGKESEVARHVRSEGELKRRCESLERELESERRELWKLLGTESHAARRTSASTEQFESDMDETHKELALLQQRFVAMEKGLTEKCSRLEEELESERRELGRMLENETAMTRKARAQLREREADAAHVQQQFRYANNEIESLREMQASLLDRIAVAERDRDAALTSVQSLTQQNEQLAMSMREAEARFLKKNAELRDRVQCLQDELRASSSSPFEPLATDTAQKLAVYEQKLKEAEETIRVRDQQLQALEKDLESRAISLREAEIGLRDAQDELATVRGVVEAREQERDQLLSEFAERQAEANEKVAVLENEARALREECAALKESAAAEQATRAQLEGATEALKRKIAQLQDGNDEQQRRISELEQAHSRAASMPAGEACLKCEILRSRTEQLEEELAVEQSKLLERESRMSTQARRESLAKSERIETLSRTVEDLQQTIATLRSELEAARKSHARARDGELALQEQCSALRAHVSSLEASFNSVSSERDRLNARLDQVSADLAETKAHSDALRSASSQQEEENKRLRSECSALNARMEQISSEYASDAAKHASQIRTMKEAERQREEECTTLRTRCGVLETKIQEAREGVALRSPRLTSTDTTVAVPVADVDGASDESDEDSDTNHLDDVDREDHALQVSTLMFDVSELQKRCSWLAEALQREENVSTGLRSELSLTSAKLNALEEERKRDLVEHERLLQLAKRREGDWDVLVRQHDEGMTKMARQAEEIEHLTKVSASNKGAMAALEQDLVQSRAQVAELREVVSDLKSAASKDRIELASLSELRRQIQSAERQCEQLRHSLEDANARCKNRERELRELRAHTQENERRLRAEHVEQEESWRARLADLQSASTDVVGSDLISELQKENEQLRSRERAAQINARDSRAEIEQLRKQIEALEESHQLTISKEREDMRVRVEELDGTVRSLEMQMQSQERSFRDREAALRTRADDSSSSLAHTIEELNQTIEEQCSKIQELESMLEHDREPLVALSQERDELKSLTIAQESEIRELRTAIDDLKEEVARVVSEREMRVRQAEGQQEEIRAELDRALQERSQAKSELRKAHETLSQLDISSPLSDQPDRNADSAVIVERSMPSDTASEALPHDVQWLRDRVAELEYELEQARLRHSKIVTTLQGSQAMISGRLKAELRRMEMMRVENRSLKAQLEATGAPQGVKGNIDNPVPGLRQTIEELKKDVALLKDELGDKTAQVAALKQSLSTRAAEKSVREDEVPATAETPSDDDGGTVVLSAAERAEYDRKIMQLEARVAELISFNATLQEELTRSPQSSTASQIPREMIETLSAQLENESQRARTAEASVTVLEAKLYDAQQEVEDLRADKERWHNTLTGLHKRLEVSEAEHQLVSEKHLQHTREADSHIAELKAEVSRLEREVNRLRQEESDRQVQFERLDTMLRESSEGEELELPESAPEKRASALQSFQDRSRSLEMERLERRAQVAEESLNDLRMQAQSRRTALAEERAENRALRQQVQEAEAKHMQLQEQLSALQSELQALRNVEATVRNDCDRLRGLAEDRLGDLKEAETKLTHAEARCTTLCAEVERLEGDLKFEKSRSGQLEEAVHRAREEASSLHLPAGVDREELEESRRREREAESKLIRLQAEVEHAAVRAESELNALRSAVDATQERYERQRVLFEEERADYAESVAHHKRILERTKQELQQAREEATSGKEALARDQKQHEAQARAWQAERGRIEEQLRAAREAVARERESARSAITALETSRSSPAVDVGSLGAKIASVEELAKENEQLRAKLSDTVAQVADILRQNEEVGHELARTEARIKAEADARVQLLENERDLLQRELAVERRRLSESFHDVELANKRTEENANLVDQLQAEAGRTQHRIAHLQAQVQAERERAAASLSSAAEKQREAEHEANQLRSIVRELQDGTAKIELALSTHEESLRTLKSQRDAEQARRVMAESEAARFKETVAGQIEQIQRLEMELLDFQLRESAHSVTPAAGTVESLSSHSPAEPSKTEPTMEAPRSTEALAAEKTMEVLQQEITIAKEFDEHMKMCRDRTERLVHECRLYREAATEQAQALADAIALGEARSRDKAQAELSLASAQSREATLQERAVELQKANQRTQMRCKELETAIDAERKRVRQMADRAEAERVTMKEIITNLEQQVHLLEGTASAGTAAEKSRLRAEEGNLRVEVMQAEMDTAAESYRSQVAELTSKAHQLSRELAHKDIELEDMARRLSQAEMELRYAREERELLDGVSGPRSECSSCDTLKAAMRALKTRILHADAASERLREQIVRLEEESVRSGAERPAPASEDQSGELYFLNMQLDAERATSKAHEEECARLRAALDALEEELQIVAAKQMDAERVREVASRNEQLKVEVERMRDEAVAAKQQALLDVTRLEQVVADRELQIMALEAAKPGPEQEATTRSTIEQLRAEIQSSHGRVSELEKVEADLRGLLTKEMRAKEELSEACHAHVARTEKLVERVESLAQSNEALQRERDEMERQRNDALNAAQDAEEAAERERSAAHEALEQQVRSDSAFRRVQRQFHLYKETVRQDIQRQASLRLALEEQPSMEVREDQTPRSSTFDIVALDSELRTKQEVIESLEDTVHELRQRNASLSAQFEEERELLAAGTTATSQLKQRVASLSRAQEELTRDLEASEMRNAELQRAYDNLLDLKREQEAAAAEHLRQLKEEHWNEVDELRVECRSWHDQAQELQREVESLSLALHAERSSCELHRRIVENLREALSVRQSAPTDTSAQVRHSSQSTLEEIRDHSRTLQEELHLARSTISSLRDTADAAVTEKRAILVRFVALESALFAFASKCIRVTEGEGWDHVTAFNMVCGMEASLSELCHTMDEEDVVFRVTKHVVDLFRQLKLGLEMLCTQHADLEQDVSRLKHEVTRNVLVRNDVEALHEKARSELEICESRLRDKESEKEAGHRVIDDLRKQMLASSDHYRKELGLEREARRVMHDESAQLQRLLEDVQSDNDELRHEVDMLNVALEQAKEEANGARAEVQTDRMELMQQVEAAEGVKNELQRRLEAQVKRESLERSAAEKERHEMELEIDELRASLEDADEANEAALQRIKELTMMVAEAYEWRERMIWLEKEVLRLKQENEVNQLVAEEERSLLMSHHQQIRTPFSTLTRR